MRSKTIALVVVAALVLLVMAVPAFAAPGGMPAAHGVDGKTFGGLVSDLAQSSPGAVAAHVAGCNQGGGMPAAHGLSGKDFGAAVSGLAKSYPGAVADHVKSFR